MQHQEPPPEAREFPSLRIAGFGDVNFGRTRRPEGPRNFVEGQLALHMASQLSPRVTFFGEISFTPRADAGTGSPAASGFNVEVERMIVRIRVLHTSAGEAIPSWDEIASRWSEPPAR